jgi:hypothetical protein
MNLKNLPIIRITVSESFRERVAGDFELCDLKQTQNVCRCCENEQTKQLASKRAFQQLRELGVEWQKSQIYAVRLYQSRSSLPEVLAHQLFRVRVKSRS